MKVYYSNLEQAITDFRRCLYKGDKVYLSSDEQGFFLEFK